MPRRHQRTKGLRIRRLALPGGRNVIHYVSKKSKRPRCSICSSEIHGYGSRAFHGVICHRCLDKGLKAAVRGAAV